MNTRVLYGGGGRRVGLVNSISRYFGGGSQQVLLLAFGDLLRMLPTSALCEIDAAAAQSCSGPSCVAPDIGLRIFHPKGGAA
jgi:hypothetical protein